MNGRIAGEFGSKINVYAQLTEPKGKDGIWIKTEEVISTESERLQDIPANSIHSSAVAIGTDIYLFIYGIISSNSYIKGVYKYDTINNTYTDLANPPYTIMRSSAVAIGTDIYLFRRRL